jgi:hypothetical protein
LADDDNFGAFRELGHVCAYSYRNWIPVGRHPDRQCIQQRDPEGRNCDCRFHNVGKSFRTAQLQIHHAAAEDPRMQYASSINDSKQNPAAVTIAMNQVQPRDQHVQVNCL